MKKTEFISLSAILIFILFSRCTKDQPEDYTNYLNFQGKKYELEEYHLVNKVQANNAWWYEIYLISDSIDPYLSEEESHPIGDGNYVYLRIASSDAELPFGEFTDIGSMDQGPGNFVGYAVLNQRGSPYTSPNLIVIFFNEGSTLNVVATENGYLYEIAGESEEGESFHITFEHLTN